jgi:uncharacterized protein (UPF0332 family)
MTSEIIDRIQKARDSLRASQLLISEGLPDFAMSRAYYTMFYIAEAFLISRNFRFSSHSATISAFGREFIKSKELPIEFHQFLLQAFQARASGDYGACGSIEVEEAQVHIERSQQFIDLAINYFKLSPEFEE